ncbi:ZIP family metal transporter [Micromonospora aurantiaca]|uniref:ZIP family metal transporter n=1 Tax=Micromonospora aurantiaca (nom. illeg.) TaxID=47850 RepID=A0ABQ6U674_9ACTN|nr:MULTISPECIES: ZIP family metal transporter [Micromonospora]KAB1095715.1 ZIP family metal transporter [Micromonospora aurantiaca]MBC8992066.1 ZIP family metal transporter [Micromonospora chalcea]MCT2279082.1 hypothetical protein [Micromonospora chalcea]MDG4752742.1 hypothetical protein [Micromonospora sp. WMMD718]OHX06970.1 hypothetical protein BFV98_30380 [Micromonospora sp. WMMB235]
MNVVGTAAILVAFPVVATVTGAVIATLRTPGPAVSSGIQHFAAGVVFAALAGELLPELRREGHLLIVVGAFTAGVVLLLALGAYSRRVEATRPIGVPAGLLAAVGVDLLVDGLLVGLGVTLGKSQGVILTIALTLEVLFLGLSVSAALAKRGAGRVRAAMIPSALGLATAAGAIGGAALLGGASRGVLAAVLAFGAAALLYLVTEELLVEAHEHPETPWTAALFFVGFLGLYTLAGL